MKNPTAFEVLVIDHETRGARFIEDYRVTYRLYESGAVTIQKVERFHEKFQAYSDITMDVLFREKEMKKLVEDIQDWKNDEEYISLPKPKRA